MRKIEFKKKSNHSLIKRFTLIEILVVVAIIGILASLLMPSLSKARKKARITVCMNNQKQINLAMVMFIEDNDNTFPLTYSQVSWDDMLSGYDGRPTLTDAEKAPSILWKGGRGDSYGELYRCPLHEVASSTTWLEMSYAIPNWSGGAKNGLGIIQDSNYAAKLTSISKPAETIMLFDYNRSAKYTRMGRNDYNVERATDFYNFEVNKGSGEMMHGGLDVNYLFVDGHVKGMDVWSTLIPYGARFSDVRNSLWDSTK